MTPSDKCVNLIKSFEGLVLESYKCPSGKWTIGYGHTIGVKQGESITYQEAELLLEDDIKRVSFSVNLLLNFYELNQNQFDALVSFAYNLGTKSLDYLTDCHTRSLHEIGCKIIEYVNCNGKPLDGLIRRRKAEQVLFFSNEASYHDLEEVVPVDLKNILVKVADNYRIRTAPSKDSETIAYTDSSKKLWYEIHGHSENWILTDKGFISKEAFPLKIK